VVKAKKSKGVCVRVRDDQAESAEKLVRHVRDYGLRSLSPEIRASLERCGVNLDSVSDVVRVSLHRLFDDINAKDQKG
jgi:hypothetical protein